MGGDEFMLVLPGLKTPKNAARVAQKCLDALRVPMYLDGHELYVSCSIGISIFPEDGEDAERLQRNADAAMYRAKTRGKNGFEFFTPDLTTDSKEWLDLRSDLHHALQNNELTLDYQPQFRANGELIGFEALLRWHHPRLGLVPPSRFIPIAEESGLILPIGNWVLHQACRQMAEWRRTGFDELFIAVNLSAIQLDQADWVSSVEWVLKQTGLPPSKLELELTESLVMQDVRQTVIHLGRLHELGVRLAIDDFGTGYSSLNYLQQLSVDTLKIDRSFIHEISHGGINNGDSYPIIRSIIGLAHSLGLQLVAEGVETEQQASLLRELGCDIMQGNLFAPPMPAEVCEELLQRTHWTSESKSRKQRFLPAAVPLIRPSEV
jgi:EAL domain-containing protein (putative c-di-GMP-specific phosphodiesterase class I)